VVTTVVILRRRWDGKTCGQDVRYCLFWWPQVDGSGNGGRLAEGLERGYDDRGSIVGILFHAHGGRDYKDYPTQGREQLKELWWTDQEGE
jgi:hypothetical protein